MIYWIYLAVLTRCPWNPLATQLLALLGFHKKTKMSFSSSFIPGRHTTYQANSKLASITSVQHGTMHCAETVSWSIEWAQSSTMKEWRAMTLKKYHRIFVRDPKWHRFYDRREILCKVRPMYFYGVSWRSWPHEWSKKGTWRQILQHTELSWYPCSSSIWTTK